MAGSVAKRPDGRWRARYRDEVGAEHSRHFDRRIDAQRWLDEVAASVVTGIYVDPKAGKVPSPPSTLSGPNGSCGSARPARTPTWQSAAPRSQTCR